MPTPVAANASAIAPASRDFLRIYPPVVVVAELYYVSRAKPMV